MVLLILLNLTPFRYSVCIFLDRPTQFEPLWCTVLEYRYWSSWNYSIILSYLSYLVDFAFILSIPKCPICSWYSGFLSKFAFYKLTETHEIWNVLFSSKRIAVIDAILFFLVSFTTIACTTLQALATSLRLNFPKADSVIDCIFVDLKGWNFNYWWPTYWAIVS